MGITQYKESGKHVSHASDVLPQQDSESSKRRVIVQYVICLGAFLSNLSAGMFNIALVDIAGDYGVTLQSAQWIVTAYLLVISVCLPLMGRLGDLAGRTRIHNAGYFIFMLGALLCVFAPSLGWLIPFRILQGLGASMYQATNMALIVSIFPQNQRGRALGLMSTFVAAGSMVGPSLGGVLIQWFSWRTSFAMLAAVAAAAWVLAQRFVPREEPQGAARLDLTGAGLFAAGLTGLVAALNLAGANGFGSLPVLAAATAFGLCLGLFIWWCLPTRWSPAPAGAGTGGAAPAASRPRGTAGDFRRSRTGASAGSVRRDRAGSDTLARRREPFIQLGLFRNAGVNTGILITIVTYMAAFSAQLVLPVFLRNELGLSPAATGLLLMAYPAALILSAPVFGRLSDKHGIMPLLSAGLQVMIGTLLALGFLSAAYPPALLAALIILLGVSMGMITSPNNSLVMRETPREHLGIISSMLALSRNLGMMFGTVAGSGLLATGAAAAADGSLRGYHAVFILCAALVAASLAITALSQRQMRQKRQEETLSS
ncbi:MFS transporter [Paenibacillus sp. YN15]|uniref:MFS transporter n=1 Tax=Paenibacillus sp. YN15 TaxID=1742774 RepID=UPI000DCB5A77|nr:MFS transporter [Paenibacillus sp. YN15]RAU92584.1 MFS transporter [Paenibacillus sp. YN15]